MSKARVFRYGAKQPILGASIVNDQILLAHRYRNAHVEVELARRAVVDLILKEFPSVSRTIVGSEPLAEEEEEEQWSVTFDCGHVQRFEAKKQPAIGGRRECKACAAADPEYTARMDSVYEHVTEYRKALRDASGLYWGASQLIEQAADAARWCFDPPRFKRWDRTGRVGVQIQKPQPLTIDGALACRDTRLRIERVDDSAGQTPGSRRAGRNAIVHMRVGSDRRHPIWACWPVTLHRLPPAGTQIKRAWMHRKRIGPDFRWFFSLTVRSEPVVDAKVLPDRSDVVAVDLGWRVRPDGLRVGYWRDEAGGHGELLLPSDLRDKWKEANSIRATRDLSFNEFRKRLSAWLGAQPTGSLPDWLDKEAATLPHWKSADRLYRLAWTWTKNRFPADESIFEEVAAWKRQDRHLNAWTAHEMQKVIGHRNELYRLWSCEFARRSKEAVIEKFDVRKVAGRRGVPVDATDAEKVRADRASSVRHLVAPGTFRLFLVDTCRARGTRIYKEPAAWTTIDCAICGARVPWDPAPEVMHQCTECGTVIDQDDQACRNLLARRRARGVVPEDSREPLAEDKSARQRRFQRRRKKGPEGKDLQPSRGSKSAT